MITQMPTGETLGQRLRSAIAESNQPQAEIARQAGIKKQYLQELLDDKLRRSKHVPKIAGLLGISVKWLLTGEGTPDGAETHGNAQSPDEKLRRAETIIDALTREIEALRGEASSLKKELSSIQKRTGTKQDAG